MNIAHTIHPAVSWGMHNGGWWIVGAVVMMAGMGAMMWMMMRGMGGSSKRSSPPGDSPPTSESALEVLERRFAAGEISTEDYRERRAELMDGAPREPVGAGISQRPDMPQATREEKP